MSRPITLFTGQWADLPLEALAQKAASWGYEGLEIACSGDHFDVDRALSDDAYVQSRRDLLDGYGLKCYAISNHLVGQCVADALIDARHREILPDRLWGDGAPEGVRRRAADEMQRTAAAAKLFGVPVVTGFTGSPVWHMLYRFPPTSDAMIEAGYREFADRWLPILDVFEQQGVKFALEVHPTEIAFDLVTAEMALEAVNQHRAFGFNFDPSHFIPQLLDPAAFIERFPDRIFHVHVKDTRVHLTGRNSILGGHLNFGDARRAWDFVSPGHGDLDMDRLIRALNRIGYGGPLSVEWEDSGMDREHGAREAVEFVRKADFKPSPVAFDAAFARQQRV